MNPEKRTPGFSLIEIMVVLAIIALLAGLAWPSYSSHVRRAHRAEAVAALLEAQQFMERYYAVNGRYTTAALVAPALPARLQAVPSSGELRYRLRLVAVDALGYQLQADPQGVMAGDECGSLTLAHTGARGRSGNELSVQQCWQ